MPQVEVEFIRFIDDPFSGFVEFAPDDALGNRHLFIDKEPVVNAEGLGPDTLYPVKGLISCEIEKTWMDESGRRLVSISTEFPWHIESNSGETRFVVLVSQMVPN